MKKDVLKVVMLWVVGVLSFLSFLSPDVTPLQLLPLVAFIVMSIMHLYSNKDLKVAIMVLAVVMFLVNLAIPAFLDVTIWLAIFIVYLTGKPEAKSKSV